MFVVRLPPPVCVFFLGGGGLYLAAFGDTSVIGLGWAGLWAEHDSMTFVGFDDGKRALFLRFFFGKLFTS